MGCDHDLPEEMRTGPWPPLRRCPWREMRESEGTLSEDQTWAALGLFRHFREGHLYASGGVADQPAVYLDAMEVLSTTHAEWEEAELKRMREAKGGN